MNQMSKGRRGLDYKIQKETELDKGGTVWSDKKARLVDCIASKESATHSDKWEEKYTQSSKHTRVCLW